MRKLVLFGAALSLLAVFLIWMTRNGGWVLILAAGITLTLSPLIKHIGKQDPAQLDQSTK